jgi:alpha,alpha-trehalase
MVYGYTILVVINGKKYTPVTKIDVKPALEHIDRYWQTLTRRSTKNNSTLIALPHPYVVPSLGNDHFAFEEQYYWDSYFTAIGINDEKLVEGMLDNLIFMFEEFGLIPNGNRYYLTSRSQPPILTTFIFHVYDKYNKPKQWLKKHMAVAKREYSEVWTANHHPHHRLVYKELSRYYDINHLHDLAEAESGWDMTPRFKRQCLDYLPIDLNCLLYKYESDFARAADILGNDSETRIWHYAAESRKKTVTELMWNKRKAFFFDYNFRDKVQGNVYSLAGYYALWSGLADDYQAKKLIMQLSKFEKEGGLSTTFGSFMYAPLFGSTKTQWAYPNGWAPLQYIAIEGLEKYGYKKEATRLVHKWLKINSDWFNRHGEFQEKYNVVNPTLPPADGLYPSQTGFGWTNGVYSYFAHKYIF